MSNDNMPKSLFGKPIVYTDTPIVPEFNPSKIVFADPSEAYKIKIPCILEKRDGVIYLKDREGRFEIQMTLEEREDAWYLVAQDDLFEIKLAKSSKTGA